MKPRIVVSFSGGKTSAYMAKKLIDAGYPNLKFVFMNTGCEGEETLRFIDRCDREWNLNVVWLEAVVSPESGKGTAHRVVDFDSASRDGKPFEDVIRKYGIPNVAFPHCTRELKERVFKSWCRKNIKGPWTTAIGIRADEPKRLKPKPRVVYPLAHDFPTTKAMVNDWWEDQPFTLNLPEHRGNCTWCWKKSEPKLLRVAKETPGVFEFPARMEALYRNVGPEENPDRRFFRGHRSALDIVRMSEIIPVLPPLPMFDADADGGCSESCEVFA